MRKDTATLRRLGRLLGRKVRTPSGVGILLSVETPANGLYFEQARAACVVWYGTGRGRWVQREYGPKEVAAAPDRARIYSGLRPARVDY